jgi:hypothetical protein
MDLTNNGLASTSRDHVDPTLHPPTFSPAPFLRLYLRKEGPCCRRNVSSSFESRLIVSLLSRHAITVSLPRRHPLSVNQPVRRGKKTTQKTPRGVQHLSYAFCFSLRG